MDDIKNQDENLQEMILEADPLKIDLDDDMFVEVMDDLIDKSQKHYKEQKLEDRRKKNEDYYLGKQIDNLEKDNELKKYNARYLDNVIFEAEGTLKAVAVSRVPDLLVKPGNESDESEQLAEDLTEIINSRMRQRENRLVLGQAYTHRPIYFTGIIKARWDEEKGANGDYLFEVIHPRNIVVDHTSISSNADDMNWIAHTYELSVKEILMRWPNKKKELFEELKWDPEIEPSEKRLASKLKITEIWFTWYKKENDKWTKIEGTAWKYNKVVFDKIKNPYWDWEGNPKLYSYDKETKGKIEITEQDIRTSLLENVRIPNLMRATMYHNHFPTPKKPFKFMSHEGLGTGPYDDTTRIEQAVWLQDNVNVRGKQITELANLAKGKNVFSTESGLDAADVAAIDMADPDSDLLVDGDLRDVYSHIPGNLPTPALFQDQEINRERIFSKMGTNAALRGVRGGEDTATQTQLFKESDFTRIDDEVEDTINAAAEWMADWSMQFMKLFYTEEHMIRILGMDGKYAFQKITRDMIEDGMEVEVSASSVDKMRRKREAYELMNMGMIDPLQFFKDIEASDPEGRAEAVLLFQTQPSLYIQKHLKDADIPQMAGELGQLPTQGPPASPPPEAPVPPMGNPQPSGP